jgi:hypothetical protein
MLARREGNFSEDTKSSGAILLGDVNIENKESRRERKDHADCSTIPAPERLFVPAVNFESGLFPSVNQ